jgi:hypothetical protein
LPSSPHWEPTTISVDMIRNLSVIERWSDGEMERNNS